MIAIGSTASQSFAQTDVGGACRTDDVLRVVTNIFDPSLGDSLANDPYRSYTLGDISGDGVDDILVVDYYEQTHYAVVADGNSGDVFYSLESVSPSDYWFAVAALPIADVDEDGVPDFVLVSHDGFIDTSDVLILSGANGSGIARITKNATSGSDTVLTIHPFTDIDKSGTSDTQDVYRIIDSINGNSINPVADLNLDGVIDSADIALSLSNAGPISSTLVSRIANAFGGRFSGMEVTMQASIESGLRGWFDFVWTCAGCLINCGDAYGAAWDCRNELKDKECDCWDLPDLFDVSACLDDLRLNFMADCIADAANAAGACGQCILDCHPLAP